jgi:hypothetical protein
MAVEVELRMHGAASDAGRTLGFSLAAGVNLYATVAILGLASRYHWVQLPDQFKAFDNPWIIGAAGVLYVVEFVADRGAMGHSILGFRAHADSFRSAARSSRVASLGAMRHRP